MPNPAESPAPLPKSPDPVNAPADRYESFLSSSVFISAEAMADRCVRFRLVLFMYSGRAEQATGGRRQAAGGRRGRRPVGAPAAGARFRPVK